MPRLSRYSHSTATIASATFGVILIGLLVFFFGWRRRVRTYQF